MNKRTIPWMKKPISRADFLKTTAGAAMFAALPLTFAGWRSEEALAHTAVSVSGFGAKGDGATDDRTAIQAAIDHVSSKGGGSVYVDPAPGGFYAIGSALYHRDNVEVYGAGSGSTSHIRNVRDVGDPAAGVFMCGNYKANTGTGGTFQEEIYYSCSSPAYGAQIVQGLGVNAGNFKIGDVVLLHSVEQLVNSSHPVYARAELNEVTAVDVANGRLSLRFPISESFAGFSTKIARSGSAGQKDPSGNPTKAVKNTVVRDITLSNKQGRGWALFPLGGCLNGQFLRIAVPESSAFMSMNGLGRCTIDNTGVSSVRFERKLLDIAYFSHQTTVRSLVADRLQNTVWEDTAISIGEGSHDITLDNVSAKMGVTSTILSTQKDAKRVCFVGTSRRVRLLNSTFAGNNVPRAVVEVYAGAVDELVRPEVRGCTISGRSAADYILGIRSTSGIFSNNVTNGVGSIGEVVVESGARSNTGSGNEGTVKDLSGNSTNSIS